MENLNGRELVEAGDLCERRNGDAFCSNNLKINIKILEKFKMLKFVLYNREGS